MREARKKMLLQCGGDFWRASQGLLAGAAVSLPHSKCCVQLHHTFPRDFIFKHATYLRHSRISHWTLFCCHYYLFMCLTLWCTVQTGAPSGAKKWTCPQGGTKQMNEKQRGDHKSKLNRMQRAASR